jgi:thiol-disulfide isomerase/thioredoxin
MRSIATIIVLVSAAIGLRAGTVNILPLQPKTGEKITIEYRADAADADIVKKGPAPLHAVVYGFGMESEAPVATDIELEEDGKGRWKGTMTVPADVVYAHLKVGNGGVYDTNKDRYWSFIVAGADGRPMLMANFRAAMACFGMLPQPCRKAEDFDEAIELLEKEVRLYPKNISAAVNLTMLRRRTEQIEDAEVQSEMRRLTSLMPQAATSMDAIGLSEAYNALGDAVQAQQILSDAARRFPNSKSAEQLSLIGLGQVESLEQFYGKLADHLDKFPKTSARQNIIEAAFNAAAQERKIELLVPFLERVKDLPATAHHMAANYFGAVDSLRAKAFEHIDKGFLAVKDDAQRPPYAGIHEFHEGQRIMRAQLHFVRGAIHRAMERNDVAIADLSKALEYGGNEAPQEAGAMLVELLMSAGRTTEARDVAERAIRKGNASANVLNAYRSLQRGNGMDSVKVEQLVADLKKDGRSILAARLAKEMMHSNAIDGTFTTLDGKPVNIADWKGKVVILDYWATWCGPCRSSFPSMQKLYEQYRNNPNVVFAIVNVWERDKDRVKIVRDFLSQNKNLTFPVYLDKSDAVVGKFGVTGIPTKFYLGKDGRVQFKEVGYLPEEQFLEEATNRIEVLLGM